MRKVFKRNIISILSYLVLETLFLRSVLRIDVYNVEFIQIVNVIGAVVVACLIIKFIFSPYIVFEEKSILINHNFTKDIFLIDDVVDLEINDGYFTLKNGKKIKFNSFMLNKKSIESLKEFFKLLRMSQ